MTRPARLVVVAGTGTEIGKTWVSCEVIDRLRRQGRTVSARKPAQSFDADDLDAGRPTDADLLGRASGEPPRTVCAGHRWYPVALAPPMAADRLGLPSIHLEALVEETSWPEGVEVGLVEAAGGVRSPLAHDGDAVDLAGRLSVDLVLLVADAGLGTISAVRTAVAALGRLPVLVVLNRFDARDALHVDNRRWLSGRDGLDVETDLEVVARRVAG